MRVQSIMQIVKHKFESAAEFLQCSREMNDHDDWINR